MFHHGDRKFLFTGDLEESGEQKLAEKYDFCGREIKNTVKNTCVAVALKNGSIVSQIDFIKACDNTLKEKEKFISASDHTFAKC